ncbi:MAG: hypothetical protein ACI867_000520, partial [Glaciecola sp.]
MVAALLPLTSGPAAAATATARAIDDGCPTDRVPSAGFNDTRGSFFEAAIDCVAWYGITSGDNSGGFSPGQTVNRAQMAAFLVNLIEATGKQLDPNPPDAFSDDNGTFFETKINQLANLGVVSGSPDVNDEDGDGNTSERLYRPAARVSRAQMASFLNSAHTAVTGVAISSADDFFTDDDGTFHEDNINAIASVGIGTGTSSTTFNPSGSVGRAAMAAFLVREIDYLVELGFLSPPVTDNADVVLDSLKVNQGRQVIGRIFTEKDARVSAATVDICNGANGTDISMNEANFAFSFTLPFEAEIGNC